MNTQVKRNETFFKNRNNSFIGLFLLFYHPRRLTSPVKMCDNRQYANNDKIDPYKVVEYLGEYHDDNAKKQGNYSHP